MNLSCLKFTYWFRATHKHLVHAQNVHVEDNLHQVLKNRKFQNIIHFHKIIQGPLEVFQTMVSKNSEVRHNSHPQCTLAPINTRHICSVWSKIGIFQRSLVHMKIASITLPTLHVFTTIESFRMRYYMYIYLKGHQKYKKSNFWLSKFT